MADGISGKKNLKSAAAGVGKKTLKNNWVAVARERADSFLQNPPTQTVARAETFSQTFHAKHECTK